MHNLKLFIYGIILFVLVSLVLGCANQPLPCPEVHIVFCPTK